MGLHEIPIPAVLEPAGTRCVPVILPDDPDYITMFVEHMRQLTTDRIYQRDEQKSAVTVRNVWRNTMFAPLLDSITQEIDCAGEFFTGEPDCYGYPMYSPFISYLPINPYDDPNTIPNGYAEKPFIVYGLNEPTIPPGYLEGDVIIPFGAIDLNPFDLFSGNLVTIKITVTGSGQIELDLLNVALGGVAVIGINKAPTLLDLLNNIFDANETTIDLELDLTSIPQELDIVHQHEIDIVELAGVQTDVYITFFPVTDDSFVPLRFGGGIRGIQLCGFEEDCADMGITDIRIQNGVLEYFSDGVWTPAGNLIEDCGMVDECLDASQIISSILSQLATLQDLANANFNGVQFNASQITDLWNSLAITNANVAINAGDIDILQTNDAGLQLQIDQHTTRLNDLEACVNCDPWTARIDYPNINDYFDSIELVTGEYVFNNRYRSDLPNNPGGLQLKFLWGAPIKITSFGYRIYFIDAQPSFRTELRQPDEVIQTDVLCPSTATWFINPVDRYEAETEVLWFVLGGSNSTQIVVDSIEVQGEGAIPSSLAPFII